VGDVFNKGPFGYETLSLIQDLSTDGKVTLVRGNHDEKFLLFYHRFASKLRQGDLPPKRLAEAWLGPQGPEALRKFRKRDWKFLHETPLAYQTKGLTVIHGGLSPKIHTADKYLQDSHKWSAKQRTEIKSIMYIRQLHKNGALPKANETRRLVPWTELYDGRFGVVVYGHQPAPHVRHARQTYGIDTACCYGNRLTSLIYEPGEPIYWESVNARKCYAPSRGSKRLRYASAAN
jgi:diadenosine tetraphosphatase ApaH/serine/threonine PP2A family protein phosphatase